MGVTVSGGVPDGKFCIQYVALARMAGMVRRGKGAGNADFATGNDAAQRRNKCLPFIPCPNTRRSRSVKYEANACRLWRLCGRFALV